MINLLLCIKSWLTRGMSRSEVRTQVERAIVASGIMGARQLSLDGHIEFKSRWATSTVEVWMDDELIGTARYIQAIPLCWVSRCATREAPMAHFFLDSAIVDVLLTHMTSQSRRDHLR